MLCVAGCVGSIMLSYSGHVIKKWPTDSSLSDQYKHFAWLYRDTHMDIYIFLFHFAHFNY